MPQHSVSASSGRRPSVPIEFPRTFNPLQRPSVTGAQSLRFFDAPINDSLPRLNEQAERRINFLPPFLTLVLCSNYFLTILSIILIVPIVELAIGVAFQDKCPVNSYIPMYLIVSGACGIITVGLTLVIIVSIKYCTKQEAIVGTCISACIITTFAFIIIVMCVFLFAWFIAGNVWIFGAQNKVDVDNPQSPNYCHPTLYNFAFWVLILTYIMTVVTCCLSCCRACFGSVSTLKA